MSSIVWSRSASFGGQTPCWNHAVTWPAPSSIICSNTHTHTLDRHTQTVVAMKCRRLMTSHRSWSWFEMGQYLSKIWNKIQKNQLGLPPLFLYTATDGDLIIFRHSLLSLRTEIEKLGVYILVSHLTIFCLLSAYAMFGHFQCVIFMNSFSTTSSWNEGKQHFWEGKLFWLDIINRRARPVTIQLQPSGT